MLALVSPVAISQAQAQDVRGLEIEEIIVTAQKRDETMQAVPISIEVLNSRALRELNLQNFFDYAQMVPSILTTPGLDEGSSWAGITMRGVNSGSRGHASTNSPTVGMYLDEMPITTQQGNVDLHLYDVSRVEVLAGPQGTLYGGSAQAGTIRVITNEPDLDNFSASVSAEGNMVDGDDTGYLLEGYVNVPINEKSAVRLVGWTRETAGWIDNVLRSRTYRGVEDPDICAANGVPCSADDITLSNDDKVRDNYNTVQTTGGRAALRVDLNENWTITPSVMAQRTKAKGHRGEDISDFVGIEQAVSHIMPEFTDDDWHMLGLTIEGKVGNFDVVYAGGYLERDVGGSEDYADYAYWYDAAYTTGYYADLHFSNTGERSIANQFEDDILGRFPDGTIGSRNMQGYMQQFFDYYERTTHEIRITTDPEKRVRGMLGLFFMDSYHDFTTNYVAPGLGDVMEMHGGEPYLTRDAVYLNSMDRDDDDRAIFGHVEFDITDDLELTVGARFFEPEQTVRGFTGYGAGFNGLWSSSGEARCDLLGNGQADYQGKRNVKPCLNVDKGIKESESIYRVNLRYHANDDTMLYATFSEGYRPGGINRNPNQGEYLSEFLTNYELGWKTQFMNRRLQLNGAVFYDEWEDFQITFAGENSITQIGNGPSADIKGIEAQLTWIASDRLRISGSGAYYDGELSSVFADYNDDGTIGEVRAPKGTPLPNTPDFKGNVIARYEFPVGDFNAYVQGVLTYIGERRSDLEPEDYVIRGDYPSLTFLDLAGGFRKDDWGVDLFIKNATNEDGYWYDTAQCSFGTCGPQRYIVRERPITVAAKFTMSF
jgi:outer membrane receptor protein involved in Fe transport